MIPAQLTVVGFGSDFRLGMYGTWRFGTEINKPPKVPYAGTLLHGAIPGTDILWAEDAVS